MIILEIYTREKESIGNVCAGLQNTGGSMVFWQSTDNLILVWTRKSRCKGNNKVGAKQTWVKIITVQVTVCVSLGGSYLIFLGIRKLKIQIEDGIPTLLEGFLEGVEVMCFKHWAALWYMVGRQYGVFIILTVVTVCGTQSGKVLYSNESVNEIALTTCLLEG